MKKQISLQHFTILFAILFLFPACFARADNSPGQESAANAELAGVFASAGLRILNQRLPLRDFSLQLVSPETPAGETLTLSDLKGDVVLLNFSATWCPSCRAEKPSLKALHNHFKDDGLNIVVVNIRESRDHVRAYMNDNGLSFRFVLDVDGRVSNTYGVNAIPTSFLIDREGYIIARFVGRTSWDNPEVRAAIETLLR